MFENRISLFKILGFEIWVDLSWLVLAVLITWSLAVGFFPLKFEGLSPTTYWLMGVVGALGIFLSIVFHELWHSIVARRYGLHVKGITLFIFGGVAEMTEEPPNAKAEFLMALAGPVSSVVLSSGFFIIYALVKDGGLSLAVVGVLYYLGLINLLLAAFNLIPGFPLDGGRLLRSVLWSLKGNLKWATNIAANVGSAFGAFLLIMGLFSILGGSVIGGIWYLLIGLFLRNAARSSYESVLFRQYLEGEPVRRFMNHDVITVPPSLSIEELVEDFIYKHHFKMFPVVQGEKILGCISIEDVKTLPKEEWNEKTVGQVLLSCSPDNTIGPDEDAMEALTLMNRAGGSRLLVVEGDRLLGLISLKDLLKFLSLKLDLEGDTR